MMSFPAGVPNSTPLPVRFAGGYDEQRRWDVETSSVAGTYGAESSQVSVRGDDDDDEDPDRIEDASSYFANSFDWLGTANQAAKERTTYVPGAAFAACVRSPPGLDEPGAYISFEREAPKEQANLMAVNAQRASEQMYAQYQRAMAQQRWPSTFMPGAGAMGGSFPAASAGAWPRSASPPPGLWMQSNAAASPYEMIGHKKPANEPISISGLLGSSFPSGSGDAWTRSTTPPGGYQHYSSKMMVPPRWLPPFLPGAPVGSGYPAVGTAGACGVAGGAGGVVSQPRPRSIPASSTATSTRSGSQPPGLWALLHGEGALTAEEHNTKHENATATATRTASATTAATTTMEERLPSTPTNRKEKERSQQAIVACAKRRARSQQRQLRHGSRAPPFQPAGARMSFSKHLGKLDKIPLPCVVVVDLSKARLLRPREAIS